MNGKRVLGILGFGAAARFLARRAVEAGSALVFHGPGIDQAPAAELGETLVVSGIADFVAALPEPRTVLLSLAAAGPSGEPGRRRLGSGLLGELAPGDLVMVCSDGSWLGFPALAEFCAARSIGCVDIVVFNRGSGSDGAVVAGGGSPENWAAVSEFLGARASSRRLGGTGAGCAVSLVRAAMEGLGIELIAEIYHMMRSGFRSTNDEIRTVFAQWNSNGLADPLLAATADALGLMDEDGEPLIEKVLDTGAAAGACAEAAALALAAGVPAPITASAACAQATAARKDERVATSAVLGEPKAAPTGDRSTMVEELRRAFSAASLLAAAEGFLLLEVASERRGLDLDLVRAAALAADGGSSRVLKLAHDALARFGPGRSILLDAGIKTVVDQGLPSLRRIASRALEGGIPVPLLSAALGSYDISRSTWLPANLSVALRDSLHSLGFERVDRPRGELYHSDWK